MTQPLVACLMPTRGRLHLLPRAIRSFRQQTYPHRLLILLNNSGIPEEDAMLRERYACDCIQVCASIYGRFHGYYMNRCCELAQDAGATIAAVFDDDDWSHPERLAEQVAMLGSTGRHCVGYRQGLFWIEDQATAWMYTNGLQSYCLGNTMCFLLEIWKREKFRDLKRGADWEWQRQVDSFGFVAPEPRFVAGVHAGNQEHYPVEQHARVSPNWRRAEEWDEMCRMEMAL